MGLLKILEAREALVKVLSQVQDPLAHINDFILLSQAHSHQLCDYAVRNQISFLKLFYNLHSYIEGPYGM
jgi:hypothetical protein